MPRLQPTVFCLLNGLMLPTPDSHTDGNRHGDTAADGRPTYYRRVLHAALLVARLAAGALHRQAGRRSAGRYLGRVS